MTDDVSSFERQLLGHMHYVRVLARALVRGDADVDDVVQDTWIAAVRGGGSHVRRTKPWLSRVVRNVVRQRHRGEKRRTRREERVRVAAAAQGTSEHSVPRDVLQDLARAMRTLPLVQQEAIRMRYLEERKPSEIAALLDVSVETVRTRVKRGLAKLRLKLNDQRTKRELAIVAFPGATGSPTALSLTSAIVGLIAIVGIVAGALLGTSQCRQDAGSTHSTETAATHERPTLSGQGAQSMATPTESHTARVFGNCIGETTSQRTVSLYPSTRALSLDLPRREVFATMGMRAGHAFNFVDVPKGSHMLTTPWGDHRVLSPRILVEDGVHYQQDLVLPSNKDRWKLHVSWKNGEPIRGDVVLRKRGGATVLVELNAHGMANVMWRPQGPFLLLCETRLFGGTLRIVRPLTLAPNESEMHVLLDEDLEERSGRVLDEHSRPQPNVVLNAYGRVDGLLTHHRVQSDANGAYRVRFPVDGEGGVYAMQPHGWIHPRALAKLATYDVLSPQVGEVQGVVRHASGAHVGADVRVNIYVEGSEAAQIFRTHAITDDDGAYRTKVPPGRAWVWAQSSSLVSRSVSTWRKGHEVSHAIRIVAGEVRNLDLTIERTATVAGRVVDSMGEPRVGARVMLQAVHDPTVHPAVRHYNANHGLGRRRSVSIFSRSTTSPCPTPAQRIPA